MTWWPSEPRSPPVRALRWRARPTPAAPSLGGYRDDRPQSGSSLGLLRGSGKLRVEPLFDCLAPPYDPAQQRPGPLRNSTLRLGSSDRADGAVQDRRELSSVVTKSPFGFSRRSRLRGARVESVHLRRAPSAKSLGRLRLTSVAPCPPESASGFFGERLAHADIPAPVPWMASLKNRPVLQPAPCRAALGPALSSISSGARNYKRVRTWNDGRTPERMGSNLHLYQRAPKNLDGGLPPLFTRTRGGRSRRCAWCSSRW